MLIQKYSLIAIKYFGNFKRGEEMKTYDESKDQLKIRVFLCIMGIECLSIIVFFVWFLSLNPMTQVKIIADISLLLIILICLVGFLYLFLPFIILYYALGRDKDNLSLIVLGAVFGFIFSLLIFFSWWGSHSNAIDILKNLNS